ncbi:MULTISPECIES: YwqG family protein [Nostocales]|uniref:DUF1963 domain-containing protein n=2 Tax=Nostocales TaxID=1161 RepID=A0A8S9T340_9CYAN|nr:YwqG family protein [Tolypothrix bouteillei]KAF3886506.1 DUF1963 domain-containing protein [Tolypothrix bouteillei VB521301]
MTRNKIFRLNSLRTSIHLEGCSVTHYRQRHEFSSEAEAEAFFEKSIQELLTQGWYDTESVPSDEDNEDFTPDELHKMFLELTERLDEFAIAITKPYLEILPYPTSETTPWQSKFGGFPYFPKQTPYPTAPDGTPLSLLAQINFAETPSLEDLPENGILQFYIEATSRTAFGLEKNPQLEQSTFRVLYFPEPDMNIDNLLDNFDFLPTPVGLPLSGCLALNFAVNSSPIGGLDYRFKSLMKSYFPIFQQSELSEQMENSLEELADDFLEEYEEKYWQSVKGHRIDGYPKFVQNDDREYFLDGEAYDFLLLQMDTDESNSIKWGDGGVGNFFIQHTALKRLDFSKVLYTYGSC